MQGEARLFVSREDVAERFPCRIGSDLVVSCCMLPCNRCHVTRGAVSDFGIYDSSVCWVIAVRAWFFGTIVVFSVLYLVSG